MKMHVKLLKDTNHALSSKSCNSHKVAIVIFLTIATICLAEDITYEKNGCIYIIGNPTAEETAKAEKYRQYRTVVRRIQVEAEIARAHVIQIETIRADAIKYGVEYQIQKQKTILRHLNKRSGDR